MLAAALVKCPVEQCHLQLWNMVIRVSHKKLPWGNLHTVLIIILHQSTTQPYIQVLRLFAAMAAASPCSSICFRAVTTDSQLTDRPPSTLPLHQFSTTRDMGLTSDSYLDRVERSKPTFRPNSTHRCSTGCSSVRRSNSVGLPAGTGDKIEDGHHVINHIAN